MGRKKNEIKPTTTSVTMDLGENPPPVNGLRITEKGELELLYNNEPVKIVDAKLETNYKRIKSPKIIHKFPLDCSEILVNPNLALTSYDCLFSIDTNTRIINKEPVSIAGVAFCSFSKFGNNVAADFFPTRSYEFKNVKGKAENLAWFFLINSLIREKKYLNKNIGIIVDSDLDLLPDFNAKKLPFFDKFLLPKNVRLIYASSDISRNYLSNLMIRLSDRISDSLFKSYNPEEEKGLVKLQEVPFTAYRIWNCGYSFDHKIIHTIDITPDAP